MFTYYLGFMVQFGDYISTSGSMQPFVLYSLSGLAIAVFFVATIFTEQPEKPKFAGSASLSNRMTKNVRLGCATPTLWKPQST